MTATPPEPLAVIREAAPYADDAAPEVIRDATYQLWTQDRASAEPRIVQELEAAPPGSEDRYLVALMYLAGFQGRLEPSTVQRLATLCADFAQPEPLRRAAVYALAVPFYNLDGWTPLGLRALYLRMADHSLRAGEPVLLDAVQYRLTQLELYLQAAEALAAGRIVIPTEVLRLVLAPSNPDDRSFSRLGYTPTTLDRFRHALAATTHLITPAMLRRPSRTHDVSSAVTGPSSHRAMIQATWHVDNPCEDYAAMTFHLLGIRYQYPV